MKMFGLRSSLAFLSFAMGAINVPAYNSEVYTGTSIDDIQLRLYASNSVPSQVGSIIWFVADTSNNGIPTVDVTPEMIDAILMGTGDNKLIFSDKVDGLYGTGEGTYINDAVVVNDLYTNANIWVVLWNVQEGNTVGLAGQTFGALDLGIKPPPSGGAGNALWLINNDLFGNSIAIIPEPSSLLLAVAGLAGLLVFKRRA